MDYKLCDYKCGCDFCPFDAIMRNGAPSEETEDSHESTDKSPSSNLKGTDAATLNSNRSPEKADSGGFQNFADYSLDENSFYGVQFWSIKPVAPKRGLLGLSDLGMKLLPSIKEIILQRAGSLIKRDQAFCWLVTNEGTICLTAPIDAKITLHNPRLKGNMSRSTQRTNENSWFMEIFSDRFEQDLSRFSQGHKAGKFLKAQHDLIIDAFENALGTSNQSLGLTMQDGGRRIFRLEEMLGPRRYYEIVCKILSRD